MFRFLEVFCFSLQTVSNFQKDFPLLYSSPKIAGGRIFGSSASGARAEGRSVEASPVWYRNIYRFSACSLLPCRDLDFTNARNCSHAGQDFTQEHCSGLYKCRCLILETLCSFLLGIENIVIWSSRKLSCSVWRCLGVSIAPLVPLCLWGVRNRSDGTEWLKLLIFAAVGVNLILAVL